MTKIPDWYNSVLKSSKKDKPSKEYFVSLVNADGTKFISMKTLCEEFGLDYEEEIKRMKKEGLLNGEGRVITAKTLVQSIASPEEVAEWDAAQNKALVVDEKTSSPWGNGFSAGLPAGYVGSSGFSGSSLLAGASSNKEVDDFVSLVGVSKPKLKKHKAKKQAKKEPPSEEHIIGFDRWDFM